MPRKAMPRETEKMVLVRSLRRCCICYGLKHDTATKHGQIAHLDQNASNNDEDNLVFLCLEHHDEYDSRTSQSKGLTEGEARHFRTELYRFVEEERRKEIRPLVEFIFAAEGRPTASPEYVADLTVEVKDAGDVAIESVRLQATEYTLQHRRAIVGMSGFGHQSGLIADRIEPRGGTSGLRSIRDLFPLRLEKLGEHVHGRSRPTPINERFYALRITFAVTDSVKRYVVYRVITAEHPYLLPHESNFSYTWGSRDASISDSLITAWLELPKKIILDHQRRMFTNAPEEEYWIVPPVEQ